ncbi:MAG: cation:proton antiporter [Candidatus Aenigmarchaeota archaeon]|nr:cation:proton antiporter [Candidatus Aenigmarchaeota archaeon]NIP40108.1 cation:proton antiporter [Candidatus Aenigmarchaeota archaeon]NIQ18185.1 cation:proton antiporter [Candidatus Aenigmarchaeota archaeon]NIS72942.1 cation:proton antiporter [Candidatus Aenigmarchaeota archaeon]
MFEVYVGTVVVALIGIYCMVWKKNMIKKVIGLGVFTNSIHLLLIAIGFRAEGIPPIVTLGNINYFALRAVDPLPQALVLTSIVIQLSVTALALGIVTLAYRHLKTLDTDRMNKLRG